MPMRREFLIYLFLISITFAAFGQVLNHKFVYFDDNQIITENRHLREGLTLESVSWALTNKDFTYWHPLTWLSLILDHELYGLNPRGFHLTNLLLHIFNVVLLFLVLRRMTGSLWQSVFVASLFGLHPLNVESVAWVVERKNMLSTFFWLLTMLFYASYAKRATMPRYLLTLVFFGLGLMAKPMLVTLPFVLLLLDYWPLGRFKFKQVDKELVAEPQKSMQLSSQSASVSHLVLEKVPFFALSLVSIYLSLWSVQRPGTVLTAQPMALSLRVANALVSYVGYIGKMIWPRNLAVFYPPSDMFAWWQVTVAALFLLLISVVALRLVRVRPYVFVGWLWYLGTLVPVIGLVQAGLWPAMADRFVYVPLIGLFIVIAWGVPELLANWRYRRTAITTAAGILLSVLLLATWTQLRYWKNTITLFQHALRVTSNNYLAHNNLGTALAEEGKVEEAIFHYSEAIKINPRYWLAHDNLGSALAEQGKINEAIGHYNEALKIKPHSPGTHSNLGSALALQGKVNEALAHLHRALQLKPDTAEVYNNLGNLFGQQGRVNEAMAHYTKALEIKPDYAEAHNNLGALWAGQRNFNEATIHYTEALRLNPDSAETHNNLGVALVELGKIDEAISHYIKALDLQPNYAEAQNNLGNAFLSQGKLDSAVARFSKALEIRPDYPVAHNNLGVALARQGKFDEAIDHFSEALRLKPDYRQARVNLEIAHQQVGKSVGNSGL